MRLLLFILAAFIVTPVLLVGGFIAHASWIEHAFDRNTPLAAHLSGGWDAMRDTFRQRVSTRFPPGTEIITTLTAQGFAPTEKRPFSVFTKSDDQTDEFDAISKRPAVMVSQPSAICNINWTVAWELDADQRVTRTYDELGGYCL